MEANLITTSGDAQGKIELPEGLFAQSGSRRILQEVVIALQGNQRRGTSNTKTRAEVSGGGRKPWKQKGTGNARSGSNRSPLWRKGGIIFGPHPRSYRVDVPEVKRRVALATALSEKAQAQEIIVIESLPKTEGKTSAAQKFLNKIAPAGRILMIVDKREDSWVRASRNITRLTLKDVRELNPWILMTAQHVVFTKPALQALESRFPQG
jgi:large subunit ribosomal protein L4